jgi:hypothetical protein
MLRSALLVACLSLSASAQQRGYVLFPGEDDPVLDVPPEHVFVHPVTAPYYHENSMVTSDVRAWFVYHEFPSDQAIGGGSAATAAVQVRLAITDWLQLVAYKDGYFDFDTPLVDEDGVTDVAAGLKWAFLRDHEHQWYAAVGVGYELAVGDPGILQNDDEFRFWVSMDKGFERLHLGTTLNWFIADGAGQDLGNSDRFSWHLHADYRLTDWFSPVVELNGYHILEAGESPLPFHGLDVANLGRGEDDPAVSLGLGGEIRPAAGWAFRAAAEVPLTDEDDLWGWRATFSIVYSF